MSEKTQGRRPTVSAAIKRRVLAQGPIGWRNWRAFELGTRRGPESFEVALYSDSRFTDELLDLGPYKVFNTVAYGEPTPGATALGLVLRVDEYGHAYIDVHPPMEEPTVGTYHGGWMADEIAALISLALGVRCEAGELTRRFRSTHDRGLPTQWAPRAPSPAWTPTEHPVLPGVVKRANLDDARKWLKSYPALSAAAATALVRSARQFQRALLIAEVDPNTAWLQLVSAVEVAAVYHVREELPAWDALAAGWPAVARELRPLGQKRRDALANLLADQVRAAARYRKFLKEFTPPSPTVRPKAEYARVKWTSSNLRAALFKVYEHRSTALHAGVPFPSPMCSPPRVDEHGVADERNFGLGVGSFDAYWSPSQLPMHLHVYAYVVASSLRSWWRCLVETDGA